MTKKKLSQRQIAVIVSLWILLVVYILFNAEINGVTIVSIIMSGIIVFIPIYRSLK